MRVKIFLAALLLVHLFLLVNLQFTAWPEMMSYAYLRNNGFLLYRDMIHPYPPILTMALSFAYKIFGYKLEVLKIISWSIILFNDVLIFLIAKKLTRKEKFAFLSLASYILLQPFLDGNQLWFDLAIVPPILLATYYMLQNRNSGNVFLAGLFLGVAALTKQTAGLFLVISALWLVFSEKKVKNLFQFFLGPLFLGIPLLVRLVQENALIDFLNWVLIYPAKYFTKFPGYVQMSLSTRDLTILGLLLLPLIFFLFKLKRALTKDKNSGLLAMFLLVSLALVYPRFSFFHFQPALAFIIILFGYLLTKVKINCLLPIAYCLVISVVIALPVIRTDWQKEARFWGEKDIKLGELLFQRTTLGDKIFLLGPFSSLYVFSERVPPKRWTDNFGWYLETPGVQEEIIGRWKENSPRYIFWQLRKDGNWFDLGVYQPKKITSWIEENYTMKEELDKNLFIWQKI